MAETLDRSSLKALSTDTRQDIVKMLSERPHTSSEIARKLGKHVTTITEHLNVLEKANLIIRKESTNKWVYYTLTQKGEKIFKPANYTWVITLSLIVVAVVAVSMFGIFRLSVENISSAPEMMSQKSVSEYYADFQHTIETNTSSIVPLTISGGIFNDENIEIEISHKETEKPITINSERIKIAEIENKPERSVLSDQPSAEALMHRKFLVRISEPVDINGEKIIPVEISEVEYDENEKAENTIDVDIIGPSGNTKRIRVKIDR